MSNLKTLNKLLSYSAMVSAVVAPNASNGQIVYTDINPDTIFTAGPYGGPSFFLLDFNHDGIDDALLEMAYGMAASGWVKWATVFPGYSVIASLGNYNTIFPLRLTKNSIINGVNPNWRYPSMACILGEIYKTIWTFSYQQHTSSFYYGNFIGVPDAYIGIKLDFNNNKHFGWIRIGLDSNVTQLTIKSFAYEATPNKGIIAGDTFSYLSSAIPCSNIMASDIGDIGNGNDVLVSFNKSPYEISLSRYDIIVVPSDSVPSFTTAKAMNLNSDQYLSVFPNGSNISTLLNDTLKDSEGNYLSYNIDYNVFVLNRADTIYAALDSLVGPSNTFSITNSTFPASNVAVSDIADNGNSSDLQVSFNKAVNESTINEYRIIVVKSISANSFDTIIANGLPIGRYQAITPNGSNIIVQLGSGLLDSDGDTITNNVDYNLFVLSVANGIITNKNGLSLASNMFKLINLSTKATNIQAFDAGNTNTSNDLMVQFDKAIDEIPLLEYRVIAVRLINTPYFNVTNAASLGSDRYISLTPNDSNIVLQFPIGHKDNYGLPILGNVAYEIFVMSVVNEVNGTVFLLSGPSNSVTLYGFPDVASNILVTDNGNSNTANDIEVSFQKANNEQTLSEYRIIVIKSDSALAMDTSLANLLPPDRYHVCLPIGQSYVGTSLSGLLKDSDGDMITGGRDYKVRILSKADGSLSHNNMISTPSPTFSLSAILSAASNVVINDIANNNNASDIEISFNKAVIEDIIIEYRIILVKEDSISNFNLLVANNLSTDRYQSVSPIGSNIIMQLASGLKDADGDLISDSQFYTAFILSASAPNQGFTNILSSRSNDLMLINGQMLASNVAAYDIADNNNSNDLQVHFVKAIDESLISEYRICVVRSMSSYAFNTNDASMLSSNQYEMLLPSGNDVITTLSPGLMDSDGYLIQNNISYKVFVLSVGAGANPTNSLSDPSAFITLSNTGVNLEDYSKIGLYSSIENDILHLFFESFVDGNIQLYNTQGQLLYSETLNGENHQVPIHQYSKGVYILKVFTDDGILSRKLVF